MKEYPKINSLFKRDLEKPRKPIIVGQYADEVFEYLKDNIWEFTEKVDGTNIRVIWDGYDFQYRGRTDNAQMPITLVESLRAIFEPLEENFSRVFDGGITLYGEGYGTKIQKGGGLYRPDNSFVLFDALVGNTWLRRESLEGIAQEYRLEIVPVVGEGTIAGGIELVRNGMKSTWGDFEAEGIVLKPKVQLIHRRTGNPIVTKLKTKDFRDLLS